MTNGFAMNSIGYGNFNSHAHVERDAKIVTTIRIIFNFNSHAHVERDANVDFLAMLNGVISTHTLTWSVTCQTSRNQDFHNISTHTLTWSVTRPS